jgi:hypothetical protein
MKQRLRRVVLVLGGCYLAAMLVVTALQRRFIYQPPAPVAIDAPDATIVRTSTARGLPVVALHWPAANGKPTIVHFHGNAEQLADVLWLGRAFHRRGLGFFAVEYPGYGEARAATPSEPHLYEVAETALVHLRDLLHVPAQRIVIEGHSLGTGVAAEMARRGLGARLVLASPFTSLTEIAARVLPIFPTRWLVRDRYDILAKAPELRMPRS